MTDKQEKILEAALELFASEGYAATPTSKIAKKAGVSEGLIFRHFKNKQGLLDALMCLVEEKLAYIYGPIFMETDPKEVLRKSLEFPFSMDSADYDFWKLQFMLKWQKEYNHPNKMKPILDKLALVFGELGYKEPEMEARCFLMLIETVTQDLLKGNIEKNDEVKGFLMRKYGV